LREPTHHFFESQRLRISYWTWGDAGRPTLMLVHGAGDHARSWDRIAGAFEQEYRVVALDLHGHGDSEWAIGNHYGIASAAVDVVALAERLGGEVKVMGHSFGGRVSLSAAAARPELFDAIVAIEATGRGVRSVAWDRETPGPRQMRRWIETVRSYEDASPRVYASIEGARDRMLERHGRLEPEWALHLARHGLKPVEGGYVWKFDKWVHTRIPFEMTEEVARALWPAVTCPVLHLLGGDSDIGRGFTDEDLSLFQDATRVVVPDAGHWVQHDQVETVIREARTFFTATDERRAG
jgi:pimeloyl-ACP methyl ester carboxylesterase